MAKKNDDLSFLNTSLNKRLATKIQDELDTAHNRTYFGDNNDAKYIDAIRKNTENFTSNNSAIS